MSLGFKRLKSDRCLIINQKTSLKPRWTGWPTVGHNLTPTASAPPLFLLQMVKFYSFRNSYGQPECRVVKNFCGQCVWSEMECNLPAVFFCTPLLWRVGFWKSAKLRFSHEWYIYIYIYFDHTIITNVMHWILFIRKILLLSCIIYISKEDVPTWCKQFYYDFFS